AASLTVHVVCTPPGATRPALIGVGLAAGEDPPAYVPVAHRYLGAPRQIDAAALCARLQPVLEDPAVEKTVHDVKQARVVLRPYVVRIEPVPVDPMLAGYLLDPGAANYSLGALAKRYLDHSAMPVEEVTGRGRDGKPFEQGDAGAATRHVAEQ